MRPIPCEMGFLKGENCFFYAGNVGKGGETERKVTKKTDGKMVERDSEVEKKFVVCV